MSIDWVCARLARCWDLTAEHLRSLAAEAGDVERVCDPTVLAGVPLPPAVRHALSRPDAAALTADVRWCDAHDARAVPRTDPIYPPQLAAIRNAPPVLVVRGDLAMLSRAQIALVGSRRPTAGGRLPDYEFATTFARLGVIVTSGLARGIDAASHEGALAAGGATIAVLGCALAHAYPAGNALLAERIGQRGAVVCELAPTTPPRRRHFPRRNPIISGLALGTPVIEATADSGSLITARWAADPGREIFAVPGSIRNPLSHGGHRRIREAPSWSRRPQRCSRRFHLTS